MEGPPSSSFRLDVAWWSECSTTRRVKQPPRKEYRTRNPASMTSDADSKEEKCTPIQKWDKWFDDVETDED